MKKYLILITIMCLVLTGCGTYKLEDAVNDFTKSVESSKSYKLNGTMEISSGEEIFTYNIDAYFLKDDFYKVVLVNQTNNHEQVILKNKEGLYVVTPSLNKSFKFDSVWPENSSQAYLLQNLVTDIKNDNEKTFEKNEKGYVIKSKVNYPNNEELVYQKIYFDKDMNITGVEVYNNEDIIKIKVTFKNVNLKAKLKEDDFVFRRFKLIQKQKIIIKIQQKITKIILKTKITKMKLAQEQIVKIIIKLVKITIVIKQLVH